MQLHVDFAHHIVPVLLRRKNEELQFERQSVLLDSARSVAVLLRRLETEHRLQISGVFLSFLLYIAKDKAVQTKMRGLQANDEFRSLQKVATFFLH